MSKVGFLIIGFLCGALLPSLFAWKPVDEANMAKPEVRVIKEYAGQFRGWQDECLNCDADVANNTNDHVITLPSIRGKGRMSRAGYCECNCQQ